MSGETEREVSGWTVDTLRSHLSTIINERDRRYGERFDAQENAVAAALQAAKEAVNKAETAAEKRFDAVNEFRGQLADQAATFMPREVAETQMAGIRRSTEANTERLNIAFGSSTQMDRSKDNSTRWILAAIGFALVAVQIAIAIITKA